MHRDSESLAEARRGLAAALALENDMERRLGVAAAIQTAVSHLGLEAVVVGGTAVEFWTEGGFTTFDIDVLLPSSDAVQDLLGQLGFERRTGRHWTLTDQKVAVEFPGSSLSDSEQAIAVEMPTNQTALVVSLEDALIQRVHEFLATGDFDSTRQALAMMKSPAIDTVRLNTRAEEENLKDALASLRRLDERLNTDAPLEPDAVHEAADLVRRQRQPYS